VKVGIDSNAVVKKYHTISADYSDKLG